MHQPKLPQSRGPNGPARHKGASPALTRRGQKTAAVPGAEEAAASSSQQCKRPRGAPTPRAGCSATSRLAPPRGGPRQGHEKRGPAISKRPRRKPPPLGCMGKTHLSKPREKGTRRSPVGASSSAQPAHSESPLLWTTKSAEITDNVLSSHRKDKKNLRVAPRPPGVCGAKTQTSLSMQ